ncbi:MATE family efflux transporter [Pseudohongiella sp. O18]|uniref:MATE family efflux transporter n=1 Tax=Pseudohongiella sp. O18 TaxID=2904248 RepID=UPI001F3A0911|nr:MATE family efflux transporter [Pseudohongiella sp. O18]
MSVPVTRRTILRRAWPVMLANASVPLLGLSDTAVIGNFGSLEALGAIAFGAIVFSFAYWSFGFLRMGTTGFVAQALGARNALEIRAALWRAVFLGTIIGCLLIILQYPLSSISISLLQGSVAVETLTHDYIHMRIWGAPAALALFALMGCLIGLGKSKTLLFVQILMNGLNVILDILFAGVLQMGVVGIALGTLIAEWITLSVALIVVIRALPDRNKFPLLPWEKLKDLKSLRQTLSVNRDIMIRTILMVASFAWFVRQSAQFGDDVLAANHILLQLISFSAFFLDAYAYIAEALVGEAMGAGDLQNFDQAMWRSTELAAGSSVLLAAIIWFAGDFFVALLNQHDAVRLAASEGLPLAALYVALAFAAFQLDGIFIGTTQTRQMRNASIMSVAVFLGASLVLTQAYQVTGLWAAFVIYVFARAVTLAAYLPALRLKLSQSQTTPVDSAGEPPGQ